MKIGFVSAHPMTYPGGVQKHILALKERFEKKGHIVKIIFPRERVPQRAEKDTILLGGTIYIPANASKANLSFKTFPHTLKKRIKEEKFDILHFQNFGLFLPLQVLGASESLQKKEFQAARILTLHALWDASKILKKMPFLVDMLNNRILPKFDGIITVSKPVEKQINYKGPLEVIPNGIDFNIFCPEGKKIKKFDDDKTNILFVGRIEERKGLIYLLKVFRLLAKKYKNIRLIVVGDGNDRKRMEEFVYKNKIPNVFFEREVKEKELTSYYRTADIFCSPAIFGEAFGIVLLEAMASKKPVVAFANQGYKEVLSGKGSEFLAEPKDLKDLIEKLERLIKNRRLREEMAEWGREEAKKYSWDEIAQRTLNFYDKVIKSKS